MYGETPLPGTPNLWNPRLQGHLGPRKPPVHGPQMTPQPAPMYPGGPGPQTPAAYQPNPLVRVQDVAHLLATMLGGAPQMQTPLQSQGMNRSPYVMAPPTPRPNIPSTPRTPLMVPQVPMTQPLTPSNPNLRDFAFGMSPLFHISPQHRLDPLMALVAAIPDSTRSTSTPEVMDTTGPSAQPDRTDQDQEDL